MLVFAVDLLALEFPLQLNFLFEGSLQRLLLCKSFLRSPHQRKRNAQHTDEVKRQAEEGPSTRSIEVAFGASLEKIMRAHDGAGKTYRGRDKKSLADPNLRSWSCSSLRSSAHRDATRLNAAFAASIVAPISSCPCAVPRNAASYWLGGSQTPCSSMARWKRPNAAVSDFAASS